MKKVLSVVLTLMMFVSMFTTASAAENMQQYIDERFDVNPGEALLNYALNVNVLARKSGVGDYAPSLNLYEDFNEGVGVDYKATLDMAPLRAVLEQQFFTVMLNENAGVKADFDTGVVDTRVTVTVNYPGATIEDTTAGSITSGSAIFVEDTDSGDARNTVGNTITIKYKNNALTAAELLADKNAYLADITFTLDDVKAAKYGYTDTYHETTVTLTGYTQITFASGAVAKFTYSGNGGYRISTEKKHVLEVEDAVAPTCTANGKTQGFKCATHNAYDCGANGTKVPQTTAKLAHKKADGNKALVHVDPKAATCTTDGNTEHWVCGLCKERFANDAATAETTPLTESDWKIAAPGHDFENVAPLAATCTTEGLSAGQRCKVCKYETDRKVIPALGHSTENDLLPEVPATCTAEGWTKGTQCSVCDMVLVDRKPIAKLAHTFDGPWTPGVTPTETTSGTETRTCTVCAAATETKVVPATGSSSTHTHTATVEKIEKAATCTETGLMQKYCECGEKMGDAEVIPMMPHKEYSTLAAGVARAATCTQTGIREHYVCQACGNFFSDADGTKKLDSIVIPVNKENHIDANGNSSKKVLAAVTATCDTDGLTEGEKCVLCNTVTVAQEKVDKLRLDPDTNYELVEAKAATCEETGMIKHYHCARCGHNYSYPNATTYLGDTDAVVIIPALGHKWSETVVADPNEAGKGIIQCERDASHTRSVTLAGTDHVHGEDSCYTETVLVQTCTEPGKQINRYTCCGEKKDETPIAPDGHDFVTVPEVSATCFKEGVRAHKYCANCGKLFNLNNEEITTPDVLGKLPHSFTESETAEFKILTCLCGEVIKTPKPQAHITAVTVSEGFKTETDETKEKLFTVAGLDGQTVKVEAEIKVDERALSTGLETTIVADENAQEKKVVLEITVEKVITTTDNATTDVVDKDIEIIPETSSLIKFDIPIPAEMQTMADLLVHRRHWNETLSQYDNDVIKKNEYNKNDDGEYFTVDGGTLTLYAKKFSEYAIVGYDAQVNPAAPSYTVGGGGSTSVTIKLNVNGGVKLDNVIVKRNEVAAIPTPVRDGYTFAGWFTDSAFTKAFDAAQPVTKSMTLYAKWINQNECTGTEADKCPCLNFYDLDPTAWYHRGVDYVLNNGMMIGVGDTQFAPDQNVTRAMLVTVLWRAEGKGGSVESKFTDLEAGQYYVDAVNWATNKGIVNGYSDTVFAPNDAITREQFAAIMHRYAIYKGKDVSVGENTNILSYTDYAQISQYAIPSMQYTAGSGLMKGRTDSTLNPKDNTTRAEMATMLYRFYTEIK